MQGNRVTGIRAVALLPFAIFALVAVTLLCVIAPQQALADQTLTYTYSVDGVDGVSDDTAKLNVSKLEYDTEDFVEGATLAILDKETGEELVRWVTSDDKKRFGRYLNEGTPLNVDQRYILREIKKPNGYEAARDTEFYISAYGEVIIVDGSDAKAPGGPELNLYDRRILAQDVEVVGGSTSDNGTPTNNGNGNGGSDASKMLQTGDVVRIALIAALALAAAVVLFAALSLRRKRRGSDAS